ncbi:hypothetical protein MUK42_35675 [Musa troglodytarum]|uniref:Uncharacterized protein n=1 Tax=Musa troglodytarum TaxID=320322 RepID=A0A9E7KEQ2_9LILI|nr:hypothetical protein MUK42_35675 [Musa troglodytarum]
MISKFKRLEDCIPWGKRKDDKKHDYAANLMMLLYLPYDTSDIKEVKGFSRLVECISLHECACPSKDRIQKKRQQGDHRKDSVPFRKLSKQSFLTKSYIGRRLVHWLVQQVQYFPRRKRFRTQAIDMPPKSCSYTPIIDIHPRRTLY